MVGLPAGGDVVNRHLRILRIGEQQLLPRDRGAVERRSGQQARHRVRHLLIEVGLPRGQRNRIQRFGGQEIQAGAEWKIPRQIAYVRSVQQQRLAQRPLKAERELVRFRNRTIQQLRANGQAQIRGQTLGGADRLQQPGREQARRERVGQRRRRGQVVVSRNNHRCLAAESGLGAHGVLPQIIQAVPTANNPLLRRLPGHTNTRLHVVPIAIERLPVRPVAPGVQQSALQRKPLHARRDRTRLIERKPANLPVVALHRGSLVVPA